MIRVRACDTTRVADVGPIYAGQVLDLPDEIAQHLASLGIVEQSFDPITDPAEARPKPAVPDVWGERTRDWYYTPQVGWLVAEFAIGIADEPWTIMRPPPIQRSALVVAIPEQRRPKPRTKRAWAKLEAELTPLLSPPKLPPAPRRPRHPYPYSGAGAFDPYGMTYDYETVEEIAERLVARADQSWPPALTSVA